jgi:alkaline phosphatase D
MIVIRQFPCNLVLSLLFAFSLITLIALISTSGTYGVENSGPILAITQGIASGDVTDHTAIIWSRVSQPSMMHVEYSNNSLFSNFNSKTKWVDNTTDLTGKIKLDNLVGGTKYFYRVWFSNIDNRTKSFPMVGTFRTAPNSTTFGNSINFIVGADIGGQKFCRDIKKGYAIFEKMSRLSPDFYIQNGDMIYAINDCPKQRPDGSSNIPGNFSGIADPKVNLKNLSQVHDIYLKHWTYNRDDPHLKNFLSNTSMYSQWDDHEVINDFGAQWSYWNAESKNRTGYPNIVKEGRDLFFDFSPIEINQKNPNRIYRSFHWGKDLDLLILDARSNRSRNDLPDTVENNKTMLGLEQVTWLKRSLLNSNATWKVISSDVPMSIPTGSNASKFGRDGWANGIDLDFSSKTGFERELTEIMRFIDDNNIKNIVFVTTDVHFPAILKYDTDLNGDGKPTNVYEIISGPLSAFRFGVPGVPLPMLDPTFHPTILYVEGGLFNFAHIQLQKQGDGKTHLITDIIGEDGLPRPNSRQDIIPQ